MINHLIVTSLLYASSQVKKAVSQLHFNVPPTLLGYLETQIWLPEIMDNFKVALDYKLSVGLSTKRLNKIVLHMHFVAIWYENSGKSFSQQCIFCFDVSHSHQPHIHFQSGPTQFLSYECHATTIQ